MSLVNLSFDDSLVDQLKWARTMQVLGLKGTFYISPGRLEKRVQQVAPGGRYEVYLTEEHVNRLAAMGHCIGNHTWDHEAPATHSGAEIEDSIMRAEEWLTTRGWGGGLLALPYGVRGGKWDDTTLQQLLTRGWQLRDVRFSATELRTLPAAWESTEWPAEGAVSPDLRYFHGNHNTTDEQMAKFLFSVASDVKEGKVEIIL